MVTPLPVARTVVAMAYSPEGRCEFTCSPPGMARTTVAFDAFPRVIAPPAIEPLTVWALTLIKKPAASTAAANTLVLRSNFIVIYRLLFDLKAVEQRLCPLQGLG